MSLDASTFRSIEMPSSALGYSASSSSTQTTHVFSVPMKELKTALYERIKRHDEEKTKCLAELEKVLLQTVPEGLDPTMSLQKLAQSAALLTVVLGVNQNLTGNALVAKAWIDRAVFLHQEVMELRCIQRNLSDHGNCMLDREEATRFGLI